MLGAQRRQPSQEDRAHVPEGFLRGQRNEACLVEVIACLAQSVRWIWGVRLANPWELYLQAKSSGKGAKKFDHKKYPHIACVIVHDGEHLADEVLEKLEYLRL